MFSQSRGKGTVDLWLRDKVEQKLLLTDSANEVETPQIDKIEIDRYET